MINQGHIIFELETNLVQNELWLPELVDPITDQIWADALWQIPSWADDLEGWVRFWPGEIFSALSAPIVAVVSIEGEIRQVDGNHYTDQARILSLDVAPIYESHLQELALLYGVPVQLNSNLTL